MGSESNGRFFELNFIRHLRRNTAGGWGDGVDDSISPLQGETDCLYREKIQRNNDTGRTIAFVGAFSSVEEAIQMDGRKWWTESDKGSEQVTARVWATGPAVRSEGVAAPEEWTSLFSRLWWKRFSRIAVSR